MSRRFNRHQVPELDVNNSCSTLFEVKLRRLMSNKIPRCCQAKPDELTHYQSSLYLILAYITHLTATYLLPSPTYLLPINYLSTTYLLGAVHILRHSIFLCGRPPTYRLRYLSTTYHSTSPSETLYKKKPSAVFVIFLLTSNS